jgi:hypothetical protein
MAKKRSSKKASKMSGHRYKDSHHVSHSATHTNNTQQSLQTLEILEAYETKLSHMHLIKTLNTYETKLSQFDTSNNVINKENYNKCKYYISLYEGFTKFLPHFKSKLSDLLLHGLIDETRANKYINFPANLTEKYAKANLIYRKYKDEQKQLKVVDKLKTLSFFDNCNDMEEQCYKINSDETHSEQILNVRLLIKDKLNKYKEERRFIGFC